MADVADLDQDKTFSRLSVEVGMLPCLLSYEGSNINPTALDVNGRKISIPRFTVSSDKNLLYVVSSNSDTFSKAASALVRKEFTGIFTSYTETIEPGFKGLPKHLRLVPLIKHEAGTRCYSKAKPLTKSILLKAIAWLKGRNHAHNGGERDYSNLDVNELLMEYLSKLKNALPRFDLKNQNDVLAKFIESHDWSSNINVQNIAKTLKKETPECDLWQFIISNLSKETRVILHLMDGNHRVMVVNMLLSKISFHGTPRILMNALERTTSSYAIRSLAMYCNLSFHVPQSIEQSLVESMRTHYSISLNSECDDGVIHGWREFMVDCMKHIKVEYIGKCIIYPLWESNDYLDSLKEITSPKDSVAKIADWTKNVAKVIFDTLAASKYNVQRFLGMQNVTIEKIESLLNGMNDVVPGEIPDELSMVSHILLWSLVNKQTYCSLIGMLSTSPSCHQCIIPSDTDTYKWLWSFFICTVSAIRYSSKVWLDQYFKKLDKGSHFANIPLNVIMVHMIEPAVDSGTELFWELGEAPGSKAYGRRLIENGNSFRGIDLVRSITNEFVSSLDQLEPDRKFISQSDMKRFIGCTAFLVNGNSIPDPWNNLLSLTNGEKQSFDMRTKNNECEKQSFDVRTKKNEPVNRRKSVLSLFRSSGISCNVHDFYFDIYCMKNIEEEFFGLLETHLYKHQKKDHEVLLYCLEAYRSQFKGYPQTSCRDTIDKFFRDLFKNYSSGSYGEYSSLPYYIHDEVVGCMGNNLKDSLNKCSPHVCQVISDMKTFPKFPHFHLPSRFREKGINDKISGTNTKKNKSINNVHRSSPRKKNKK